MWGPLSPDFTSVADAIFDLERASWISWFSAIHEAMLASLPAAEGMLGVGAVERPDRWHMVEGWSRDPSLFEDGSRFFARQPLAYRIARYRHGVASDWQLFGPTTLRLPHAHWMRRKGFHDIFGMNARSADGTFAIASFLVPGRADSLPRGLMGEWELVVRQLVLGAQLRRRARKPGAIVRLDGTIVDADDRTWAERAVLRELVRRLMRSRTSYRDRANPLAARRGGRWILVDRFDSDGRHVIVAHADGGAAKSLSKREHDVAELLAAGRTHKAIAIELGLSLGSVASYSHRIYAKLAIHGRVQLARALARGRNGN